MVSKVPGDAQPQPQIDFKAKVKGKTKQHSPKGQMPRNVQDKLVQQAAHQPRSLRRKKVEVAAPSNNNNIAKIKQVAQKSPRFRRLGEDLHGIKTKQSSLEKGGFTGDERTRIRRAAKKMKPGEKVTIEQDPRFFGKKETLVGFQEVPTYLHVYKTANNKTFVVREQKLLGQGGFNVASLSVTSVGSQVVLRRPIKQNQASEDINREKAVYEELKAAQNENRDVRFIVQPLEVLAEGAETLLPLFDLGEIGSSDLMDKLIAKETDLRGENGAEERAAAAKLMLAGQMCQGLANLHAMNIIHNDFKPAQVFVRSTEDGFEACVSDFGKADREGTLTVSVDHGTPQFYPPEYAAGALGGGPFVRYIADHPGLNTWNTVSQGQDKMSEQELGVAKDSFALGLSLFDMFVGEIQDHFPMLLMKRTAMTQDDMQNIFRAVESADIPENMKHAIVGLLALDPRERWTADQAADMLAEN